MRACSRRSPGLIASSARYQVMVMTTAAAAATRMAIAAVSTVMEVARAVISPSRRALKAPRWGGTVGIAGRESMGNALLNAHAQGTHTPSRWSVALLRRRGQEHGHQRDEGGRQPEQLGGNQRGHGVTQAGSRRRIYSFSVASAPSGSRFWPCRKQKLARQRWLKSRGRDRRGPAPAYLVPLKWRPRPLWLGVPGRCPWSAPAQKLAPLAGTSGDGAAIQHSN